MSYKFDVIDSFGVNDLFSAFLLGILLKSGFDLILSLCAYSQEMA